MGQGQGFDARAHTQPYILSGFGKKYDGMLSTASKSASKRQNLEATWQKLSKIVSADSGCISTNTKLDMMAGQISVHTTSFKTTLDACSMVASV